MNKWKNGYKIQNLMEETFYWIIPNKNEPVDENDILSCQNCRIFIVKFDKKQNYNQNEVNQL